MNVYLVIWEWMNNGMGLSQYQGTMVKQILQVIPTTVEKVLLNEVDLPALTYRADGRYLQWELVFRPDNQHLEERTVDLEKILVNFDSGAVCLSAGGKVRWVFNERVKKGE